MKHTTVELQGVRIQIQSENEHFVEYVGMHLPDHIVPERTAEIAVHVRWLEGDDVAPEELKFPGEEELDRLGKRLLASPTTLVWTDTVRKKNLRLRFELQGEHLKIDAIYHYAPRKKKLEQEPDYRSRESFRLMSWLVYHPLAWYLEHFRALYLMHASGIELSNRGILIAGVGGVGKTTTGVSLLAQGGRLVSENLVFYDAERIYSCYEPIRVDDRSIELLGPRRDILKRATIPEGAKHKNTFQVDRKKGVVDVVEARTLFIPRFTHESYVKPLGVEECLDVLLAFNELTREVNDYHWFAATLSVLWPTRNALERRVETTRALLRRVGRYEIGIDRRLGVEPVIQAILERTLNGAQLERGDLNAET